MCCKATMRTTSSWLELRSANGVYCRNYLTATLAKRTSDAKCDLTCSTDFRRSFHHPRFLAATATKPGNRTLHKEREANMTRQLFSTVEVSRLLGVAEHRLNYAHRCGRLAEPKQKVANKRVYTTADLRRVADYFNVAVPATREERE